MVPFLHFRREIFHELNFKRYESILIFHTQKYLLMKNIKAINRVARDYLVLIFFAIINLILILNANLIWFSINNEWINKLTDTVFFIHTEGKLKYFEENYNKPAFFLNHIRTASNFNVPIWILLQNEFLSLIFLWILVYLFNNINLPGLFIDKDLHVEKQQIVFNP